MSGPLVRRWPGLAALPRLPLTERPTPVERLEALSADLGAEVWVKRDDRVGHLWGGNKVRRLELELGEAARRGADTVVTGGAWGSNHVAATAVHGEAHGLAVHAVVFGQPWSGEVAERLRVDLGAGAVLHRAASPVAVPAQMLALQAASRTRGARVHAIAPGGSSPLGNVAYVEAGLELADQIAAGEVPEPDAVYVALGSGGTCVGIALGLAAAGLTTPVVGVRVSDARIANRPVLGMLARATVGRLRALDDRFPRGAAREAMSRVRIDGTELGRGYGHPTPAGEDARARARAHGLRLDATYTAKTFAALLRDVAPRRRVLFWHTLSGVDPSPWLERAPALPRWAQRRAARSAR